MRLSSKAGPVYEVAEIVAGFSVVLIAMLKLRTKYRGKNVEAN